MKKSLLIALAVLLVASTAWAGFGMPKVSGTGNALTDKAVNKGIDMGTKKGLEKIINDKLVKYNCAFKNDKSVQASDVSCDINKISGELATWKNGLESTVVNKVKVNVMANHMNSDSMALDRARNVCNKISQKVNWWDCVETTGIGSNAVRVSVSVN